jgi:hypothetical protein
VVSSTIDPEGKHLVGGSTSTGMTNGGGSAGGIHVGGSSVEGMATGLETKVSSDALVVANVNYTTGVSTGGSFMTLLH